MDSVEIDRLLNAFPAVSYLRERAKKRIPHFAWEYLDSGTGRETSYAGNETAMDEVQFLPRFMRGKLNPVVSMELFGRTWGAPLGIAPVGLTGLQWPGGELYLATAAKAANIPYCMSSVVCETPEAIGAAAGGNAWFQLYALNDAALQADILDRARDAGFSALVLTVDVPVNSTRERQKKAGMTGSSTAANRLWDALARPSWLLATLRHGQPRFRMFDKYMPGGTIKQAARFLTDKRLGEIGLEQVAQVRKHWKGPLAIKGILHHEDVAVCIEAGADAIWVSNHGGRQVDAAPPAIEMLPAIAETVGGRVPVLFDSGVRSGLDVMRAIALGADFVFAGRAFQYGLCALGEPGGHVVAKMLRDDLVNNMIQVGAASFDEVRQRVMR